MRRDPAGALTHVVWDVLRHPVRHLLRKWNYKAAITSATIRSVLFFIANISVGWTAATAAWSTEFVFRFATAGFYGAMTQAFRRVEPARTGLIAAMVALPLIAHSLELAVHWWRGTANLGLSIAVSLGFTAFSTSFNLFAMRRGILIVGEADRRSLVGDLRAMPRVVWAFIAVLAGLKTTPST
jgi:hypothetical protein